MSTVALLCKLSPFVYSSTTTFFGSLVFAFVIFQCIFVVPYLQSVPSTRDSLLNIRTSEQSVGAFPLYFFFGVSLLSVSLPVNPHPHTDFHITFYKYILSLLKSMVLIGVLVLPRTPSTYIVMHRKFSPIL